MVRKLRSSISFDSHVVYHVQYVCVQNMDVCVCMYAQTYLCFKYVYTYCYVLGR